MKATTHWLMAILTLILCAGLAFVACDCDDDDDDNDDNSGDDDAGDDDAGDDDAADDDAADDDAADDDAADDDAAGGDVWTDSISGLMWQNGDECGLEWEAAIAYCENLSWGGYSDWRLPTISELRSLIRGCPATEPGGSCEVTDSCLEADCCNDPCSTGCPIYEGPGAGGLYLPAELKGDGEFYWSSSRVGEYVSEDYVWPIEFSQANTYYWYMFYNEDVRCVR